MKWQSFLIFFAVLFASFALDASFDNETVAIKPYLADSSSCLSCHSPQEKDTLLKDTAKSCDNKCLTCHKDITDRHHPIGVRSKQPNLSLDLTKYGRLGCRTCHDLHQMRFDTSTWKSETFYQRLFNRQDRYHTYYLPVRNNEGELCRQCHK